MIFLDHNSTTPYSASVQEFIKTDLIHQWANPSANYDIAFGLAKEITSIKKYISEYFRCSEKSIVFTSGATESINTVLSFSNLKRLGVTNLISSKMEHKATLDSIAHLESQGFAVNWIQNNQDGAFDLSELNEKLNGAPKSLCTFMLVNNETGSINPIKEMSEIVRKNGHLIHVDAVQGLGKIPIDLTELDVDFASFSGHKVGSLKGVGLLYAKDLKNLVPLIKGGGQEDGLRSGTYNFAAIKSFKLAVMDSKEWDLSRIAKLRDHLEEELSKKFDININCKSSNRVVNTSNIAFLNKNSLAIQDYLTRNSIYVSVGSACNSACSESSHVIRNLGFDHNYASSCIRISLGNMSTANDIENVIISLDNQFRS